MSGFNLSRFELRKTAIFCICALGHSLSHGLSKSLSYVLRNPLEALTIALAAASTRTLGVGAVSSNYSTRSTVGTGRMLSVYTPPAFMNAQVGQYWQQDVTSYFGCGVFDLDALTTKVCPEADMYIQGANQEGNSDYSFASWVSWNAAGNLFLQGTPEGSFWQRVKYSVLVKLCLVDPNSGLITQCPKANETRVDALFSWFLPNTVPTVLPTHIQDIQCPDALSCTGTFLKQAPIDLEGDPLGFGLSFGLNESDRSDLTWAQISSSGLSTFIPPSTARGADWRMIESITNPHLEGKILHSNPSDPTQSSVYHQAATFSASVRIPHSTLSLSNPLNPSYVLQSFTPFSLSLNTLFATLTGGAFDLSARSLPSNASFDSRLALLSWTPTPDQRGSYLIYAVGCQRPSSLCQNYSDFCTPLPPICINTSTILDVRNTNPTWLVNPLPGASGSAGDLVQTVIYAQYSQDLDQDPGNFSLGQLINHLNQTVFSQSYLPTLIAQALGQMNLQWRIPQNIPAGAYNFLINRTDPFGATATTLWTVTVSSVLIKHQATAYSAATFGLGITAIALVFIAAVTAFVICKKRRRTATAIAMTTARVTSDLAQADTVVNLDGVDTGAGAGAGAGSMPQISPSSTPPVHLRPPSPENNTLPRRPAPGFILPPLLPRGTLYSGDLAALVLSPRLATLDASHAPQAGDLPGPSTVFEPRVSITRRHSAPGLSSPTPPH